jgi:hypothetical protein
VIEAGLGCEVVEPSSPLAAADADAARRFFRRPLSALKVAPGEVVTDDAAVYPDVPDESSRRA